MKAAVQISLLVLVVVTVGRADDEDPANTAAVNDCMNLRLHPDSSCSDFAATESCLKKLTPKNDRGKNLVKAALDFNEEVKNQCPGINQTETCLAEKVDECMDMIYFYKASGNKEICTYAPKAKSCVLTANSSDYCVTKMWHIEYSVEMLDNITAQCSAGQWDDGPCSPKSIGECSDIVYSDYEEIGTNDFRNLCKPGDVEGAKSCLVYKQGICTTDFQQEFVEYSMSSLEATCPQPSE